jgi:hypothetical protein
MRGVTPALINSQIESLNNDFRLLNDEFLTAPDEFKASASDPEIELFLEYAASLEQHSNITVTLL